LLKLRDKIASVADQTIYDAALNGDVELLQDFILVAPESLDLPDRLMI